MGISLKNLFGCFREKKIVGPFIFMMLLFLAEWVIKSLAFGSETALFELGPKLSLWSSGIFFTLAISEQTKFHGTVKRKVVKKANGRGIEIDYDVDIPEDLEFSSTYLLWLIAAIVIWMVCVVLSNRAIIIYNLILQGNDHINIWSAYGWNFIAFILSFFITSKAMSSLKEVYIK